MNLNVYKQIIIHKFTKAYYLEYCKSLCHTECVNYMYVELDSNQYFTVTGAVNIWKWKLKMVPNIHGSVCNILGQ